ncbi:GNAT family N-acetyltransferase [Rhizobium sp. WYJ-E13]|uniref:GNAT family N-acetyltransferase n=1 Tax=Rhizobium sp. WYJ-E13 TaxID=2849093 RepID=UPI001C1E8DD4|nr:GNAT family N-acetyltransferase [Rhizobium sp. WYJ-E13]QWW66305.1 GNAT family N-acetyltransferase [Rhizobium sp. WYJ-E13]
MREIEIPTERTILRSFRPEDASEAFACISPEITRFTAWEAPASEEAFAEVWQNWLPAMEDGSELTLVPRSREDSRCLGILGVHAIKSDRPELGIWLRRDVHGKRFGNELIGAVARWVSKTQTVRYFEYPVAEENIASRRIAEAYGGEVREHRQNRKYGCVVYHIPPILP